MSVKSSHTRTHCWYLDSMYGFPNKMFSLFLKRKKQEKINKTECEKDTKIYENGIKVESEYLRLAFCIQDCWGTYAVVPWIKTRPDCFGISPNKADNRED